MDGTVNNLVQRRMERFGITWDHVAYIMAHYNPSFGSSNLLIYRGKLPDGRTVKVQADSDGIIRDVYMHSQTNPEG